MIIAIILILLIFIAVLSFSVYAYRKAFHVSARQRNKLLDLPHTEQYDAFSERTQELIREMEAIPFEEVTIQAEDGTLLYGRYYHISDKAPVQIQFHGYRSAALRDFCGGNHLARQMGHNSLLIDERAHGKSGSNAITFGIRERQDCLAWARYAYARFGADTPIFLSGISMGAATVLMASDLPLPETVVGIIADSPYSSPSAIIRKVSGEMGFPPALAFPFVKLGAFLFSGLRFGTDSALESVAATDIPILLLHGEADHFVPCEMSREIHAACKSKSQLYTFPDAGHGLSFMVDTPRYQAAVEAFVRDCLADFPHCQRKPHPID